MTNNGSLEELFTTSRSTSPSLKTEVSLNLESNHNSSFTIAVIVIGVFIAFTATCLNLLIILTFAKTRSLRETPSNVLIIGLAISDFGVGVFTQPLFCVYQYGILKGKYFLMAVVPNYSYAFNIILCLVSFFSLTAITVDRFLAVHLHLRYQELVTTKRYGITLACIWVTCLVPSVLIIYFKNHPGIAIPLLSIMCGVTMLNLSLILKIAKVIHRHSVQIQAQHQTVQLPSTDMPRYKKSVNTMYIVMVVFVLCYVPLLLQWLYFMIFKQENNDMWKNILKAVSEILLMSNSAINPIIYCWRIEEMRNAAKRLIQGVTGHLQSYFSIFN